MWDAIENMFVMLGYTSRAQIQALQLRGCFWIFVSVLGILALLLIGHHHTTQELQGRTSLPPYDQGVNEYDLGIRRALRIGFKAENIASFLQNLTETPHLAGSEDNARVGEFIADTWRQQGLMNVHFCEYEGVLLSYPDFQRPNTITLKDEDSGEILFQSKGLSEPLIPNEQDDPTAWVRFNAYSAEGKVTGETVYCNYGTERDFNYLLQSGIKLKNKICIIRYGLVFRGDKIWEASRRGVAGVILYTDPIDQAKQVWMPPGGVQRGTLMRTNGDPLTPLFPAKNYTFRSYNESQLRKKGDLPSIPVVPTSYEDIYALLKELKGKPCPDSWQGGLNFTYHLGPGYTQGSNIKMELNVRSKSERRTIRNVIGYIPGMREPNRYVIVGNHYDAWTYGSIDPNSSTAVMLELSRVYMETINQTQWSPARTVVFCAWDAEEYGLVGSTEWVEEYMRILEQRAIVYINVDLIPGNFTLRVETTPSLYRMAVNAAKAVPNPRQDEIHKGRETVYDTWIYARPNGSRKEPSIPKMFIPEDGSDHAAFLKLAGVPVINFRYENLTLNPGASYPLYHSLYETKYLPEHLMDPANLSVHVAVGQYWAELIRQMVDLNPIPLNLTDLALAMEEGALEIRTALGRASVPQQVMEQYEMLEESIILFENGSLEFHQHLNTEGTKDLPSFYGVGPLDDANIRLMSMERCFLNPKGSLPGQKELWRNMLWGTDPENEYQGSMFPGVYGALFLFKQAQLADPQGDKYAREIQEQLSILQYGVECAILNMKQFP